MGSPKGCSNKFLAQDKANRARARQSLLVEGLVVQLLVCRFVSFPFSTISMSRSMSRQVQPKALGSLIGDRAGQLDEKQRKNGHVMDPREPQGDPTDRIYYIAPILS